MSLVSGPGRAKAAGSSLSDELQLMVEKHVHYVQSLDKVRDKLQPSDMENSFADSAKMSSSTG